MFIMIDNYDSFTYNLVHYFGMCGIDMVLYRNDQVSTEIILNRKPKAIILSPGPCSPAEAGICVPLIQQTAGTVPILGVCLGHQSLGYAYGAKIPRSPYPVHGKVSKVIHTTTSPLFQDVPEHFDVTRYHSLCVDEKTLSSQWQVDARSDEQGDQGLIMAMSHKKFPLYGVQFHPESIRTVYGMQMIRNFIAITHDFWK